MDRLSPLYIIIFGSMRGKSECSEVDSECLLIFSHKATSNSANYENLCLSYASHGMLWQWYFQRKTITRKPKKVPKNNTAHGHGNIFGNTDPEVVKVTSNSYVRTGLHRGLVSLAELSWLNSFIFICAWCSDRPISFLHYFESSILDSPLFTFQVVCHIIKEMVCA